MQLPIVTQQNHPELVRVNVEGDSGKTDRNHQQFVKTGTRQATDRRDARGELRDGAYLARHKCWRKCAACLRQRGKAPVERIGSQAVFGCGHAAFVHAATGLASGSGTACASGVSGLLDTVTFFDAGLENNRRGRAVNQRRRRPMYRTPHLVFRFFLALNGMAENIEHARQHSLAHRCHQRRASVAYRHAARQALRGCEGDATRMALVSLGQYLDRYRIAGNRAKQRANGGQLALKANIDYAGAHCRNHT